MASVNCPPSSYPTYPGGAPTKRETLCFSWYSLISIRVIIVSSSKRNSASALASSVLPTPVVPRKMKEPIGRLGSCNPARLRRTASDTAAMASSCPITRWCNSSSRWSNLSFSLCIILLTGIPVQRDTTSAISSASTSSFIIAVSPCISCNFFWVSSISLFNSCNFPYRISATFP